MTRSDPLMDKARAQLGRVFGFPGFRPGQEEIIGATLGGEDVLAVMQPAAASRCATSCRRWRAKGSRW